MIFVEKTRSPPNNTMPGLLLRNLVQVNSMGRNANNTGFPRYSKLLDSKPDAPEAKIGVHHPESFQKSHKPHGSVQQWGSGDPQDMQGLEGISRSFS